MGVFVSPRPALWVWVRAPAPPVGVGSRVPTPVVVGCPLVRLRLRVRGYIRMGIMYIRFRVTLGVRVVLGFKVTIRGLGLHYGLG